MFAALFGDAVGHSRAGGGPARGGLRVHVDHFHERRRLRGDRFSEGIMYMILVQRGIETDTGGRHTRGGELVGLVDQLWQGRRLE